VNFPAATRQTCKPSISQCFVLRSSAAEHKYKVVESRSKTANYTEEGSYARGLPNYAEHDGQFREKLCARIIA